MKLQKQSPSDVSDILCVTPWLRVCEDSWGFIDGSCLQKVELDENIVTLKLPEQLKACAELRDGVWRGRVGFGPGKGG